MINAPCHVQAIARTLFLLCVAAYAFATVLHGESTAAEPWRADVDLFEQRVGGYDLYRIPGIVVTSRGTILAYCEARKNNGSDWDQINLVMRRSTDGGRTFSPMRRVGQVAGPLEKHPLVAARRKDKSTLDDITYNNIVGIPDGDIVHFLFCLEYMRCFYMRTEDDGISFTTPVEITPAFDDFHQHYPWRILATGPGHGLRLRNGRLVVPVWLATGEGENVHHPSVTSTIYSDDAGGSWHAGEIAVPDEGPYDDPNETIAVELADGRTMLIVRSESKPNRKLVTYSADGSTGWSKPEFHDELLEPICMASVCRLSLTPESDKNRILFSNPDTIDPRPDGSSEPGSSRQRKNVSVKLSYDEGRTWPVVKPIQAGNSGYSDLAVLPDGTILCLHERWEGGERRGPTYFLTLARFNLEWLTDGKDRLAAGKR